MATTRSHARVQVDGKTLELSNLAKVFYPAAGFTKGQVVDYYVRVAPALLPHVRNRPLTLKRYPNGVDGEFFYEKRCPPHRPSWICTVDPHQTDPPQPPFCVIDSLPTLVWVVNLASIELHTLLSTADDVNRPTMLVFDLDPGAGTTILECIWVGQRLKELLDGLRLRSFPKTSGGKGLHLAVPLNIPVTYDDTEPFAKRLAQELEQRYPGRITSNMKKDRRVGKVFVDWSQNVRHKTTVCAYSLRARERPSVSTPVTWEELEAAAKRRDLSRLMFRPDDVLKRVKRLGDLHAPVQTLKQRLLPGKDRLNSLK